MNSPLLSIVIPSYNKVKYIEKTLKSIVDQSYTNYEVIVQDGGSTDGTVEVIKKYAKKYPKHISFVSKKDSGQLDAINKGLKKSKGDMVAFINADDVYTKGTFESVAGHFGENPNAFWFIGKAIVVDEKDREIAKFVTWYKNVLLFNFKYSLLLTTNFIMQPSVFLTKRAIKKYGLFTGIKLFVMEYDMWLKIGKHNMPVVINKVLSKFRLEKDTKTSVNSIRLLAEDEKIVKKYTKNGLIIFLHSLNNFARKVILYFV
jgi:glycosyltransferase involved in cell wall biosynthesis